MLTQNQTEVKALLIDSSGSAANSSYFQITVYRCSGDRDKRMELDEVIMTALFKAQHLSPTEQLSLALAWNRCDIATKEIFTYGISASIFTAGIPLFS